MPTSKKAQSIIDEICNAESKLGDLRKIAKDIKKDHDLAIELWSAQQFHPRMLAVLIMDIKKLDPEAINSLIADINKHQDEERLQLADWLMANQLLKNKSATKLVESWQDHESSLHRRIFWYHQARLRWMGNTTLENTSELLATIEKKISTDEPEVQWAMNFTMGWIGVYDLKFRNTCIQMGQQIGLYKDEVVPKNCSPNYVPHFIELEAAKRNL